MQGPRSICGHGHRLRTRLHTLWRPRGPNFSRSRRSNSVPRLIYWDHLQASWVVGACAERPGAGASRWRAGCSALPRSERTAGLAGRFESERGSGRERAMGKEAACVRNGTDPLNHRCVGLRTRSLELREPRGRSRSVRSVVEGGVLRGTKTRFHIAPGSILPAGRISGPAPHGRAARARSRFPLIARQLAERLGIPAGHQRCTYRVGAGGGGSVNSKGGTEQ